MSNARPLNCEASGRLAFRRQFLLARSPQPALQGWKQLAVGNLCLHAHPDLFAHVETLTDRSLALVGQVVDPRNPSRTNEEIVQDLARNSNGFDRLLGNIRGLAGRYVLIYRDQRDFRLVQDALALREVYYCVEPNQTICGSQPHFVAAHASPALPTSSDPETLAFYNKERHAVRAGRLWVGDGTFFDGIQHLLPNHCLDLHSLKACRSWPAGRLQPVGFDDAVDRVCMLLQGAIKALSLRHSLMMAVTAGHDSRTLLAASREVADRIYFFINNRGHLSENSPDLRVPRALLSRAGQPFHVHDVPREVDPGFRRIFFQNAFLAHEKLLPTIYNVYYKQHQDRVNLLGVGEIGRALWGPEPKRLTPYRLAYALGYKSSAYATRACARWLREILPVARENQLNILTMLLWEQLLGNWGCVGNAESDIAIEEIDPFASHEIYETMLGAWMAAPERASGLFPEMIRRMWPELLSQPINPPGTPRDRVAHFLERLGIYPALRDAKYNWNRLWNAPRIEF